MINYWWVTRPKRRLDAVPEVLTILADVSLNQEWEGQRDTHLSLEEALEGANLKRVGERRDQTGGGARTYQAWLESLGLVFTQKSTKRLKLTLAGEAIMDGASPIEILTNQILKYQFPSAYSIGKNVNVSRRFKIRPFRFLLKLLSDSKVEHLTEEEIAKIIIVEAENESNACYDNVVEKLLAFRSRGDSSLSPTFYEDYAPGKGSINPQNPFSHLKDTANTFKNWLEYTQLAKMNHIDKCIRLIDEKRWEVGAILQDNPPFIDRPEDHEYFQRKFGLDPKSKKDTRNLTSSKTISPQIIAENKIKQAFVVESLKTPISRITPELIEKISIRTGMRLELTENVLFRLYPYGAIGSFMTKYFELAFGGKEEATEFEKATAELFSSSFGLEVRHIGAQGLTPDVLIISREEGFAGIIDNKASGNYSISNDHRNRMIHNYIRDFKSYCKEDIPLLFFVYIAGGFSNSINNQLQSLVKESDLRGSAISVSTLIKLIENHSRQPYTHTDLLQLFSIGRQITSFDLV